MWGCLVDNVNEFDAIGWRSRREISPKASQEPRIGGGNHLLQHPPPVTIMTLGRQSREVKETH